MFISITFTKTSIDETNKTQQKVRGSKIMFKMSTIHANTFKRLRHCAIAGGFGDTVQSWWQVGATQLQFLEPGV